MADNRFTTASNPGSKSAPVGTGDKLDPERMVENAKTMANELIGAVRDSATSLLDEQKRNAADQIASLAGMMRDSVKSLDRQNAGAICRYAEDTAEQIDGFAERLRTGSWSELAGDVEDFARRWPGVFVASAIAVGFIAGRFLVSSAARAKDMKETMAPTTAATSATGAAGMTQEPPGSARYDYGTAGGATNRANAGYTGTGPKETL